MSRVRISVAAREVRVGDRLDAAGKVAVRAVRALSETSVVVAYRTSGSRAPGVTSYEAGAAVSVWREA